jgi:uncharacterized membrane protein HdeD (DUF308 family)
MSENVKALTSQAAPWSKQVAWWLVVVEGGVALLLGLFVIFQPEQANVRFIQIVGGYLLVTSALGLYRLVAHKEIVPGEPGGYVRTGIGLVAGLIALFHTRMGSIDTAAATTVLAIGLMLSGVIGLYGLFATRAQAEKRWGQVLVNFLYLIFAYAVFVHNRSDAPLSGNLVWWIGILTTGAGAVLIVYGLRLRSAAKAAAVAMAPATDAAIPQATAASGQQPAPQTAAGVQATKAPAAVGGSQTKVDTNHSG